ncbi:unnamed protein product [Durusdinium trenchii]|uniref:Uncharacterized protein n=1 Tax=Durusdinium trenchii TaxID=1381693 RepID=A0ABP0S1A7_9DINO
MPFVSRGWRAKAPWTSDIAGAVLDVEALEITPRGSGAEVLELMARRGAPRSELWTSDIAGAVLDVEALEITPRGSGAEATS